MGPRQQPARGAAGPRPPAQAAGAGPSGQPVGHGRRPLTGACACALFEGCRRVRLRTVGAQARGRGIFKHGRNERRRRRLRRAGGLRGRPGQKGAAQLRRAARIARRHGRQGAKAGPARGSEPACPPQSTAQPCCIHTTLSAPCGFKFLRRSRTSHESGAGHQVSFANDWHAQRASGASHRAKKNPALCQGAGQWQQRRQCIRRRWAPCCPERSYGRRPGTGRSS